MLQYWFVPTWCGDFRLEASGRGGKGSILTVEDPTERDRELLAPFLAAAKERGWIKRMPTVKLIGKTVVRLPVSVADAGPVLVSNVRAGEEVWTALRFASGKVTVEDGLGKRRLYDASGTLVETTQIPAKGVVETAVDAVKGVAASAAEAVGNAASAVSSAVGSAVEAAKEAVSGGGEPEPAVATAAVSVTPPKRGCPAPTPAQRRASEVLRTFSTRRQWESFERTGSMLLIGGTSGMSYRLFHRDEAAKRRMGHSLVEARSGVEVCAWDNTVPPEEEMLALKLAVEHRERWLRSPHGNARDLARELA